MKSSVTITKSGPKLTSKKLCAVEKECGVRWFPSEYRQFMLKHNGGIPEPGYMVHLNDGQTDMGLDWVTIICPITDCKIDSLNFLGFQNETKEYAEDGVPCPEGSIAIACNGCGDPILLFIKGSRRGEVWLKAWGTLVLTPDKEYFDPEAQCIKIAASFNSFLNSLVSEDEAYRLVGE